MKLILIFLALAAIFCGLTATSSAQIPGDTFQMGNKQIIIPAPKGFAESLSQVPAIKDMFTATEAEGNHLLAAHIPNEHLEIFKKGEVMNLTFYTKVSVSGDMRNLTATEADFADFVKNIKTNLPAFMDPSGSEMKKTLSRVSENVTNLKSEKTVYAMEKPLNLGQIVDGPNAYGVILLTQLKINAGGREVLRTMLGGLSAIRVRERIVYIYTYKQYAKEQDIADLKTFTGDWLGHIAAANK